MSIGERCGCYKGDRTMSYWQIVCQSRCCWRQEARSGSQSWRHEPHKLVVSTHWYMAIQLFAGIVVMDILAIAGKVAARVFDGEETSSQGVLGDADRITQSPSEASACGAKIIAAVCGRRDSVPSMLPLLPRLTRIRFRTKLDISRLRVL